jgi:hypothetical protein
MRASRAACLVLASLNALAFAAQFFPKSQGGLEARFPLAAKSSRGEAPRGAAVPFRRRGEAPEPPSPPALPVAPHDSPPAEAPVDSATVAYLGAMTSPEGTIEYFFKNRTTNRVYATGPKSGEIAVLEASEKEFLIDIDGTHYKVAR